MNSFLLVIKIIDVNYFFGTRLRLGIPVLSPPQRTPFRLGGGQCENQAYAILHLARELTKQIARFIDYWRVTTPHCAYACGSGGRGLFFSSRAPGI